MTTIETPADLDLYGSIGATTELVPAAGRGAPIAPPTYAVDKQVRNPTWKDRLALTEAMTVPTPASGWSDVRRDAEDNPVHAPAVLINSIGAEAHQLSSALLDTPIGWGRIVIAPWDVERAENFLAEKLADNKSKFFGDVTDPDTLQAAIIDLLTTTEVDSWEASHRTADALIRTAEVPGTGRQVWQGGPLKQALLTADPRRDVEWIWRNAANAVLFGFWMSNSGSGFRAKWARAVTSEILGYGVSLVKTGAMKTSPIGDVSNQLSVTADDQGALVVTQLAKADEKTRPSTQGLGQVPGPLDFSSVACQVILRRSGISLTHLRQVRVGSGEKARRDTVHRAVVRAAAAAGMYALAAVSSEGVFLRSGTDLSPASTVWKARTRAGAEVDLTVDPEKALGVLEAAMADLDELGLGQAAPIELTLSKEQAELIARSAVLSGNGKSGEE